MAFVGIETAHTYVSDESSWPSLVLDVPAGVQDGDLLIAYVFCFFSTVVRPSTPSGWTLVDDPPTSPLPGTGHTTYIREADSEPANYDFGDFNCCVAYMAAYTNVVSVTAHLDQGLYDGPDLVGDGYPFTVDEDTADMTRQRVHYTLGVYWANADTGTRTIDDPTDGPALRGLFPVDRTATDPDRISFGLAAAYDEVLEAQASEPARSTGDAHFTGGTIRGEYRRLIFAEEAETGSDHWGWSEEPLDSWASI